MANIGGTRAQLDRPALEHYARQGWTVVPGFFSAAETAQLVRFVGEVCDLPEVADKQMIYRESSLLDARARVFQRIENFCPYHPGFDKLIRGGRLQWAVEEVLHGPAVLFKEKINFKMSGGAGFEPHQDQQAGWSRYAPLFVTALVSIDAATLDNGCLEMANCPRQSAYNRASDGDHRAAYYADKRGSFPPDVERLPGVEYRFRV